MRRAATSIQILASRRPNASAKPRPAFVLPLLLASLFSIVASMVALAEVLHQRASRSAVAVGDGATAVVVLGYPTRPDGRPHPIQRWRVRLGVRTMRATSASRIVFTGGAAANEFVEAETMASLARAAGVPADAIDIETQALSTWQNVAYTAPLVEDFEYVIIASDPMHAKRARQYWLEQRPADIGRVFVSDARRPFESAWSSVPTAVVEIVRSIRRRLQ